MDWYMEDADVSNYPDRNELARTSILACKKVTAHESRLHGGRPEKHAAGLRILASILEVLCPV